MSTVRQKRPSINESGKRNSDLDTILAKTTEAVTMVKNTDNQNSRKSIGPVLHARYESDYSPRNLLNQKKFTLTSVSFEP